MANSVLKGWGAVSKLKEESAARQKAYDEGKFKPRAFSLILKENSDRYPDNADISFIDAEPTVLPLVTYQNMGKWTTRRYQGKKDPVNKVKGIKPKQTCLFTIVDHTPRQYQNQEGATIDVPCTVRYLALSVNQADSLLAAVRRSKKKITDCVVNVSKSGKNTNFLPLDRDGEIHLMPDDEVESFDFEEVFPLDVEVEDEIDEQPESKF
jgi:hypothetical protein